MKDFSPVDYDAWNRGYMPPAEHRLIHALIHEGARVVAASGMIVGEGWWIVMQGEPLCWEENYELMMLATERQLAYAKKRRAVAVPMGEAIRAMFGPAQKAAQTQRISGAKLLSDKGENPDGE